jgi:hypothetical protein
MSDTHEIPMFWIGDQRMTRYIVLSVGGKEAKVKEL